MRGLNLQGKIVLPTVIIALALVIVMTVFSVANFAGFTGFLLSDRINAAAGSLKANLEEYRQASITAAVMIAENQELVNAIMERDTESLIRLLTPSFE